VAMLSVLIGVLIIRRAIGRGQRHVDFHRAGSRFWLRSSSTSCGVARLNAFVSSSDKKSPALRPRSVLSFFCAAPTVEHITRLSLGCAHFDASAISCCQRVIAPAIAAPRMGASQNSQSCVI
jgi:hypothetical protein